MWCCRTNSQKSSDVVLLQRMYTCMLCTSRVPWTATENVAWLQIVVLWGYRPFQQLIIWFFAGMATSHDGDAQPELHACVSDAQSGASCHSSNHGAERWAAAGAGSVHVLPMAEQDVSESASCGSATSRKKRTRRYEHTHPVLSCNSSCTVGLAPCRVQSESRIQQIKFSLF